jgi:hypothetical protein
VNPQLAVFDSSVRAKRRYASKVTVTPADLERIDAALRELDRDGFRLRPDGSIVRAEVSLAERLPSADRARPCRCLRPMILNGDCWKCGRAEALV